MTVQYSTIEQVLAQLVGYSSVPRTVPSLQQWSYSNEDSMLICTDTEQSCITTAVPLLSREDIRIGWYASTWFTEADHGDDAGRLPLALNVLRASQSADIEYVIPVVPREIRVERHTIGIASREANLMRTAVKQHTLGGKHYRHDIESLQRELSGLKIDQFLPGIQQTGNYWGVGLRGTWSSYPFRWNQGGPAHIIKVGLWEGRYPMNETFGVVDEEPQQPGSLFCTPRIYPSGELTERILQNIAALRIDSPDFATVFPEDSSQD